LSDPDFDATRVHSMKLSPGDCIYIPAYWFYQVQNEAVTPSMSVTY